MNGLKANKNWRQCINVMRVDVLKMSALAPNNQHCKFKVMYRETRTTLILNRYRQKLTI